MADTNLFGYSFNPTQSQQLTGQLNGLPGSATQALRVLSFNLPSTLAGSPVAPAQLLTRQLGQGQPFGQTFAAPPTPPPSISQPASAPPPQPGLGISHPSPFSAGNVPPQLSALITGALAPSVPVGAPNAPGQPPQPQPPVRAPWIIAGGTGGAGGGLPSNGNAGTDHNRRMLGRVFPRHRHPHSRSAVPSWAAALVAEATTGRPNDHLQSST
jgi:hypothetical protein